MMRFCFVMPTAAESLVKDYYGQKLHRDEANDDHDDGNHDGDDLDD